MKDAVSQEFILHRLINHISHAIFWKDTQFVFRGCNQKLVRQFGLNEPKDIIGKTDFDFPLQ